MMCEFLKNNFDLLTRAVQRVDDIMGYCNMELLEEYLNDEENGLEIPFEDRDEIIEHFNL